MTRTSFVLAGMVLAAALLSPVLPVQAADLAKLAEAPRASLSLDQAIKNALEKSLVLRAQVSKSGAARADIDQARALPNPELSVEAENIMGDGPYDGFNSAEVTYGVTQLIEMPGKRSGRMNVAKSGAQRSDYETQAFRLELIQEVTIAFAEAVAAVETVNVLDQQRSLTQSVYDSVSAKVMAGKEPPIQGKKAQIALSNAKIALDRANRAVATKMQALSVLMDGATYSSVDKNSLPVLAEPEALAVYKGRLMQTPDYFISQADIAQAEAHLAFEKANAVPDPTFNVGVRDFRDNNSQAFIAGVSLPIPVFNRNSATIAKSGHLLNAAKFEQRGNILKKETRLLQAYDDLVTAYRTVQTLQQEVLPGAQETFGIAQESYQVGKLGYLEMLDAQRTLFDARQEMNAAQLEYYRAKAAIDRLTAGADLNKDKEAQ